MKPSNIHVLLMRLNVVIGGQLMPKSGRGSVFYHPGRMKKEGILFSMVVIVFPVILLYYLGKIFPFWQDERP